MTSDKMTTANKQQVAAYDFRQHVDSGSGLTDLIVRTEQQLAQVGGKAFDHERVARLTMLCRMAAQKTPQLLRCTRESWLFALLDSAKCGLEPDGELGAVIPYGPEARFQPMVRGLVRLVADAGICHDVDAVPVYQGEHFRVLMGTRREIEHEIDMAVDRSDKNLVAAYAVFRLRDGAVKFDVLSRAELDKRRAVSRAKTGPWVDWYTEMCRKTVVKHGLKYLPRLSAPLRDAVEIDTRADIGDRPLSHDEMGDKVIEAPAPKNRGVVALRGALGVEDPPPREPGSDDDKDGR